MRIPPPLYYQGYSLLVVALVSIVPGIVGALMDSNVKPSLVLIDYGVVMGLLGILWIKMLKPSRPLDLGDAILAAAIAWVLVPLAAAAPVSMGLGIPFLDAWYESISGFTTTGLTMFTGQVDPVYGVYVPSVEELPHSIQFWRSFIQWVGGIGIIVIFAAFIIGGGLPAHLIGFAEGRYVHLEPSIARSVRGFIMVYVALTLFATLLFIVAGMSPYDAINHAMTGIATGGFSTRNASFASYNSYIIELAGVVVMTLGALNFADHYNLLIYLLAGRGEPLRLLRNPEHHVYALLVGFWVLTLTMLMSLNGYPCFIAFRYAIFQFVSALSGTGFQTMNLHTAPSYFKLVLTAACLTGGAILSTTGGIKLYRLLILFKTFKWTTASTVSARGIILARKIGREVVEETTLVQAVAIVTSFITTWIIGSILTFIFYPSASFSDVLFETASALGNVGLSTGITGAATPLPVKLVHMVLMTLGRLEIVPFIVAGSMAVTRTKRLLKRCIISITRSVRG